MSTVQASTRTTIVTATAGTVIGSIRNPASNQIKVYGFSIFSFTAPTTSAELYLAIASTLGTGTVTGVTGVATDRSPRTPLGVLATAWATAAPTGIGTPLEGFTCGPNIGAGIVWQWVADDELFLPASSELVLVTNAGTAPGTWRMSGRWEEG
jgi:hypothetical protein